MSDIAIRTEGRAGRITLTRPAALNALTHDMIGAIDAALQGWADDPAVALVLIDAEGDRAFCAGGDIAQIYHAGKAGDLDLPRRFWRDEYRMNARIADYPKPVVALMQGFTMGGGVGLGGHCSHRVVGESSRIAMPECGIGFVPDVGGSFLLSRAPGRLGEYLGLTSARMGPGCALHAGFADAFVPAADWPALVRALIETGDPAAIEVQRAPAPESPLAEARPEIDTLFAADTLPAILESVGTAQTPLARDAQAALARNAPLSMAITLAMLARLRAPGIGLHDALELEYRVSHRVVAEGELLEGVRAAIIDKDRAPRWRHDAGKVPPETVAAMLAPLGPDTLKFTTE